MSLIIPNNFFHYREAEITDTACTNIAETPSKRTRTKKRPFSPDDNLTPRRKKYTKMQVSVFYVVCFLCHLTRMSIHYKFILAS